MQWRRSAQSNCWQQQFSNQSGSAVAATVLMLPYLVSLLLLGTDVTNIVMTRSRLQLVVMSAARAGAATNTTNQTVVAARVSNLVRSSFTRAEVEVRTMLIANVPCIEVRSRIAVAGLIVGSRTLEAVGHAPAELP